MARLSEARTRGAGLDRDAGGREEPERLRGQVGRVVAEVLMRKNKRRWRRARPLRRPGGVVRHLLETPSGSAGTARVRRRRYQHLASRAGDAGRGPRQPGAGDASANYELARGADEIAVLEHNHTEDPDLNRADFHQLRGKLLETALPFYQSLIRGTVGDRRQEAEQARAYLRLGWVYYRTGAMETALADYRQAQAILERLVVAPGGSAHRGGIGQGPGGRRPGPQRARSPCGGRGRMPRGPRTI